MFYAGSFGVFSYKNLITALIAGAVLLNIAHTVTTYVALYTLGVRSKLYGKFINEKVHTALRVQMALMIHSTLIDYH
jgi:NADH:ubiquinone oxidoreductase subunit K